MLFGAVAIFPKILFASVGIDGELIAGSLPVKQLKLVQAWAAIHEEELYAAWNKAVKSEPFGKIDPLQ